MADQDASVNISTHFTGSIPPFMGAPTPTPEASSVMASNYGIYGNIPYPVGVNIAFGGAPRVGELEGDAFSHGAIAASFGGPPVTTFADQVSALLPAKPIGPQPMPMPPGPWLGMNVVTGASDTYQGSSYQGSPSIPYVSPSGGYTADEWANAVPQSFAAVPASRGRPSTGISKIPSLESDSVDYGPYKAAQIAVGDIDNEIKNKWTSTGRFAEIGGKEFQQERLNTLVDIGYALPEEPPDAYQRAQDSRAFYQRKLRNDYADRGDFSKIGTSQFAAEEQELLQGLNLAPPPSSYDQNVSRIKSVQLGMRNEWSERGDFAKIGSEEYQSSERSALEGQGLIAPLEPEVGLTRGQKYLKSFEGVGGAIGLGMTAAGTARNIVSQINSENAGNYVTNEQHAQGLAQSILPGVGGLAGMGLGALAGPQGAIFGQFAGTAGGEVVSGIIGSGQERAQSTRETADQLVAALGEATSKVREFSSQIEATGAPVKQLQSVLGTIGGVAPTGGSAIAGAGAITNALGQYAEQNYASVARQLSDPTLFGSAVTFAQNGALSPQGYRDLGTVAAMEGDAPALAEDNRAAQAAELAANPKYQAAVKLRNDSDDKLGWLGDAGQAAAGKYAPLAKRIRDYLKGKNEAAAIEQQQTDDPTATDRNDLFKNFGFNRQAQAVDSIDAGAAATDIAIASANGASASQMAEAGQGFVNASNTLIGDYNQDIGLAQQELAKDPNGPNSQYLRRRIAQGRQQAGSTQAGISSFNRDVFMQGLGEEQSQYGLRMLSLQLGGASARDVAGDVVRQDAFLGGVALDPSNPLSPTQRDAITSQRARVNFQQAQSEYGQEEGAVAISGAAAGAGVARAQAGGGAGQVYQARGGQIDNLIEQERQLQSELDRGNLLYDQRQQKLAQIQQISGQIVTAESGRRNEYFEAQGNLLATNYSADIANADRDIRRGGNAAFNPGLLTDTAAQIGNAQNQLAAARTPQERANAQRSIAMLGNQQDANLDMANTFTMGAEEQSADITTRGRYGRSLLNPYSDGPESNPFTRGRAVLALDQRELRELDANKASRQQAGTWRPEDDLTYTRQREGYLNDQSQMEHAQRYALFNAVPEMLIGAGGTGGAGTASLPTAALSAAFSPSPVVGGFGRTTPAASAHMEREGGIAGAFTKETGTTNLLLRQILDALRNHGVAMGPTNNTAALVSRLLSLSNL